MTRVSHWTVKLDAAIEAARNKPFAWGEHDCCSFAAHVAGLLMEKDFYREYRGKYRDARSGFRLIREVGGIGAIASKALGHPISPVEAQRGDVVLLDCGTGIGPALGICAGELVAAPAANGLAFIPMQYWVKAWRV